MLGLYTNSDHHEHFSTHHRYMYWVHNLIIIYQDYVLSLHYDCHGNSYTSHHPVAALPSAIYLYISYTMHQGLIRGGGGGWGVDRVASLPPSPVLFCNAL